MNNEEKIRLVLDVLGVDSVAKARQAIDELDKSVQTIEDTGRGAAVVLDDLDEKIEDVGDSGRRAKKDLDDLDKTIDKVGDTGRKRKRDVEEFDNAVDRAGKKGKEAAGTRGPNGQGILTLAYAIDDLQYGLKGIVNNIPQVAQALGLGMGIAGVAGIAAVAINQLTQRHPEWFEWSNKVQLKLGELADQIKAEEEAVKRQKKAVDDLETSNKNRIEDILKLKQATEDLKASEEALEENRANRKAAEESAKDVGVLDREALAKNRQVFKEYIEDTGSSKRVQDTMRQRLLASPDLLASAGEAVGTAGIDTDLMSEVATQFATDNAFSPAYARDLMNRNPQARQRMIEQYSGRAKAAIQERISREVETIVERTVGSLSKTASTNEEFQRAFRAFAQVMPQTAGTLEEERQIRIQDEEFERGNQLYSKRAAERRAREKELASVGPSKNQFETAERQRLINERAKAEAEQIKQAEEQAAIRNQVIDEFDPIRMAAMRRQQAGVGRDARRNLQMLEGRDIRVFQSRLMQGGMGRGEAEQAALESLRGGEAGFQDMAKGLGYGLNTAADGFRASVAVTQQLNMQIQRANAEIEAVKVQLHAIGAGNGAPSRPQMRRRIGN